MQTPSDAQNEVLTSLPAALAGASEREVLNIAASGVARLYQGLGYIRVLLVSQHYHPSQLLELCADQRMAAVMAEASNAYGSAGSSISTASEAAYSCSHQAAMRQGMPVYTPLLQQQDQEESSTDFTDWRVLQQQFGMHSFAAVPLMVAGTVHGVILAASAAPHTFTPSSMHLLRTVANMLAPYAAVLYKHSQIQSARGMLEQLLPARVVAAAIGRLSVGGNSAVDVFVPAHHDLQPEG